MPEGTLTVDYLDGLANALAKASHRVAGAAVLDRVEEPLNVIFGGHNRFLCAVGVLHRPSRVMTLKETEELAKYVARARSEVWER